MSLRTELVPDSWTLVSVFHPPVSCIHPPRPLLDMQLLRATDAGQPPGTHLGLGGRRRDVPPVREAASGVMRTFVPAKTLSVDSGFQCAVTTDLGFCFCFQRPPPDGTPTAVHTAQAPLRTPAPAPPKERPLTFRTSPTIGCQPLP